MRMTLLHQFGELLRTTMQAVPLVAVRCLFVGTLLALLIWVWRLPNEVTSPPGGAKRWDENLKLGAALALLIQIVVYSLL
jgi:hypothetical protein